MIWLIGNKGMLGHQVSDLLDSEGLAFVGSDREVDITSLDDISGFVESHQFEIIINCAAYTAVDKAEEEIDKAYALNCIGPKNLAIVSKSISARLIHISTDYVFNGRSHLPLEEDVPTDPVSVYGRSKRDGEDAIRNSGCVYDIVRTAWLYGKYGPNFVKTMLGLMKNRDNLRVVDDQSGSPTWAADLAKFLVLLAGSLTRESGVFHFSNEGETTWYGFAKAIYLEGQMRGLLNHEVSIEPCSSSEYPTKAVRPAYSLMSKRKIQEEFNWTVPEWGASLKKYFDTVGEGL